MADSESGYPTMAVHAGNPILAPPHASGVLWVRHDIEQEPRFDLRDLPRFGSLMNSGVLLWKAGCHSGDLQIGWGTLRAKQVDIGEAMDTSLTMENEFEVYIHARSRNLWQYTLKKEYDK
eukprot:10811536-Alexandrium_andersonii.AAC.1